MSAPSNPTATLLEALQGVLGQVAEPVVVLRAILERAVADTGADRGVFVEAGARGSMDFRVLHGYQPAQLEGDAGRFSRHLFERVLSTGEAVVLDNAYLDPFFSQIESVQALRTSAILCMPIEVDGRVAALVHLEHRAHAHFTAERCERLRTFLAMAAPVLGALRAGREVLGECDSLRVSESRFREEAEASRTVLAAEWSFGRFVGRSAVIRELEAQVRRAAAAEFPVLLTGETGTGKSLLARALHYTSARATQALVTVFCPSLEKGMVEAELFGHKRGAFTGATADRPGKVQTAERGTLFLDEVGELPLEIQPKLLRLLQERTYECVGDPGERRADVRVIAATNRDLEAEAEAGRFRRDLFERLNFVPIRVPPLRERPEDIPLLLRHCLDQTEKGRWIAVAPSAEAYLCGLDYAWPGNVRQIEQLAARLTLEDWPAAVEAADLERLLDRRRAPSIPGGGARGLEAGLPALLEDAERGWLQEALRRHPGLTRAELATRLRISESALYKKLRDYQLG